MQTVITGVSSPREISPRKGKTENSQLCHYLVQTELSYTDITLVTDHQASLDEKVIFLNVNVCCCFVVVVVDIVVVVFCLLICFENKHNYIRLWLNALPKERELIFDTKAVPLSHCMTQCM